MQKRCLLIFIFPFLTTAVWSVDSPHERTTQLEHFIISHHGAFTPQDLLEVRRYLQNVRREVGRDFAGYFPRNKITVILTDPSLFHSELTMPESVSGLYDGKIHLPIPWQEKRKAKVEGVLWHEYTHALISDLAGNQAPRWFNEGMAVYQETKQGNSFQQRDQTVAQSEFLLFDIELIETALESGLYDEKMLGAYQSAYIYCRYLFDRFSKKKHQDFLKEIASTGDWKSALKSVYALNVHQLNRYAEEKFADQIANRKSE